MRKFYFFLTTLLCVLCSMTTAMAQYSVTVKVDASDRLYYNIVDKETWDSEEVSLKAGENVINFSCEDDETDFISINVVDGFGVKSFKNVTTGEDVEEMWGSYALRLGSANNGNVFEVVTYDENESRTAEMPIWVDNASKVSIFYANNYKKAQDLVDGDNIFHYNPETETSIRIAEANYGVLYKVLVNGVEVEAEYDQYEVECSPENKVEIFANFPDVDVPVTFAFANAGSEEALANVSVNDVQLKDYLNGITVKLGDRLAFELNNMDWNVTEVTLNGEVLEDNYYSWVVRDEKMDFVFTAEKHKMLPFTIIVNDPNAVSIYKGEIWNDIKYTDLVAGENAVEVSTAEPMIVVMANSGAVINSITQNGEEVFEGWMGYAVEIAEGDVIVIDAKAAERTAKATVWVDDASLANYVCGMTRGDESPYDDMDGILVTGENIVIFDESVDNPFTLTFSGENLLDGTARISINGGDLIAPEWFNNFEGIVLNDGDYIKVFLNPDNATAITSVDADTKSETVFNLNGVKVVATDNLPAGIYVKNGKKIMIK